MPEFANPYLLLLLPLAPLLFVWQLRRRRAALRFADARLFAGLPHGRARRAPIIGAGLRALALLGVIGGMAGTRLPDLKTRIPTETVAIMIVLDASGSMQPKPKNSKEEEPFLWQEGSPKISRREAAQRALKLFVAGGNAPDGTHFDGRATERGTDAIGLVTFSNWPQTLCPPTLNHSVLLRILKDFQPPAEEGSNHGDAIAEGLIRLEKMKTPRKVLILLSDGVYWYPDVIDPERKPLTPRQAAQLAANLGIAIYVIDTYGELPAKAKPADIKEREDAQRINQSIAELTGGRVFTANDGKQLLEVCKTIDGLERQPILSHSYRRYRELYPWFAGAALLCVVAVALMETTRWRRIP